MSKCIWIRFDPPSNVDPAPIEYDGKWQQRYPTFEAFCDNFKTGWGEKGTCVSWGVSDGPDVQPLEWQRGPETGL